MLRPVMLRPRIIVAVATRPLFLWLAGAPSPTTLRIGSLIGVTGDPTSPVWYVTSTGIIAAFAIRAMPESHGQTLEG